MPLAFWQHRKFSLVQSTYLIKKSQSEMKCGCGVDSSAPQKIFSSAKREEITDAGKINKAKGGTQENIDEKPGKFRRLPVWFAACRE